MIKNIKKACVILIGSIAIWAIGFFIFLASVLFMPQQESSVTSDAIVVLTGGEQRIEKGLELFAYGKANHLLITGVHPNATKSDIIKRWTGRVSLPSCCITLGYKAKSTVQNATETREFLSDNNYSSIRLVTADFHMRRALIEFKHALPDIEIISHPVVQPDAVPGKLWFLVISFIEYNKVLLRTADLTLKLPTPLYKDKP